MKPIGEAEHLNPRALERLWVLRVLLKDWGLGTENPSRGWQISSPSFRLGPSVTVLRSLSYLYSYPSPIFPYRAFFPQLLVVCDNSTDPHPTACGFSQHPSSLHYPPPTVGLDTQKNSSTLSCLSLSAAASHKDEASKPLLRPVPKGQAGMRCAVIVGHKTQSGEGPP